MIASIVEEGQPTKPAPFGHALIELARIRQDIIGMTADLAKYTDLHIFAKAYPDRFYQMGMAEQLLMGAASGLAHEGAVPFVTTYAVFASRRAFDFIHQTIGGLGEAIGTELLRAGVTPPFRQIALPDAFLKAGALPMLHERYGISANAMSNSIKGWLG
jgi:transketolase C-terminal domain/subunit